jgi:hypothetical protein
MEASVFCGGFFFRKRLTARAALFEKVPVNLPEILNFARIYEYWITVITRFYTGWFIGCL